MFNPKNTNSLLITDMTSPLKQNEESGRKNEEFEQKMRSFTVNVDIGQRLVQSEAKSI